MNPVNSARSMYAFEWGSSMILLTSFGLLSASTRLVRPTVCFNNINAQSMNFERVSIKNDVVVMEDVIINKPLLIGSEECVACEQCVCPEGPEGPQGPIGGQGPQGLQGSEGPVGVPGQGSEGIPTSIAEYYFFAVHGAGDGAIQVNSGTTEVIPTPTVFFNDGWSLGSSGFSPPVDGLYELTYEVRYRRPTQTNLVTSVNIFLIRPPGLSPVPLQSELVTGSQDGPLYITIRSSCIAFLEAAEAVGVALRNTNLLPINVSDTDGINAIFMAVYLGDAGDGSS